MYIEVDQHFKCSKCGCCSDPEYVTRKLSPTQWVTVYKCPECDHESIQSETTCTPDDGYNWTYERDAVDVKEY